MAIVSSKSKRKNTKDIEAIRLVGSCQDLADGYNWKNTTLAVEMLKGIFNPYRSVYLDDLEATWKRRKYSENKPGLQDRMVHDALLGRQNISWLLSKHSRVIGFDIDAHKLPKGERAWYLFSDTLWTINDRLHQYYKELIDTLGEPSMVFRSTNGMHVYYFLTKEVHVASIKPYVSDFLSGLNRKLDSLKIVGEHLPTEKKGLRIPAAKDRLVIKAPFQQMSIYDEFDFVSKADLFERISAHAKTWAEPVRRNKPGPGSIELADNLIKGIRNNASNKLLLQAVSIYKLSLDDDKIADRVSSLLPEDYKGALHDRMYLLRRIGWIKPVSQLKAES